MWWNLKIVKKKFLIVLLKSNNSSVHKMKKMKKDCWNQLRICYRKENLTSGMIDMDNLKRSF